MRETITDWLTSGKIDLFLGYKKAAGHPLPHAFTRDNLADLEDLVDGPARYSLEKMAHQILKVRPELKIGLLARNCTRRALNVLTVHRQLPEGAVVPLEVGCCPSPLQPHAVCSSLDPLEVGPVKKEAGIDNNQSPEELAALAPADRFHRWLYEFQKCLKCYGCRNICPVCFCAECSLEHPDLIAPGTLPPEVPIFHLVRAVHMAGRCIDCGLCEEACPVDIPLRLLYRKVNDIVRQLFGYQTGLSLEQSPFSLLVDRPAAAEAAA